FERTGNSADLLIFPTRRSSDLGRVEATRAGCERVLHLVNPHMDEIDPAIAIEIVQLPRARGIEARDAARGLRGLEATTPATDPIDRKSTRLNSSHVSISYAVRC